ncbi:Putative teichuronic acid biosynthesis glycosyltransferase TuaH [Roseovarius albus]|uniref:Putative teichuronic acid biosynthesis glycosyltransferase TuaH n=1 Tax=Roseovarius albus TaxID=1247867 RepID=A0A1X6ZRM3_9RHOB|nr:glycosyltransferase [Roseovarius albus]SLN59243.1 Putative teichuronic acid biosynthesis glycosyltransferase TuaH [Roseovarius albus]
MTTAPHILFHRPTLWDSDIQCSTKVLARLFAGRGFDVSYLENPLDPIHLLRGKGYAQEWKKGPRIDKGVRILNLATPMPVRDVWPLNTRAASYLKYSLMMPSLQSRVMSEGRSAPDLIWTTVPGSVAALKKCFPQAQIVFHVVDYYPAFRGPAVVPLERQDYSLADAVYVIGTSLKTYLLNDLDVPASKVTVLGQGAELEIYQAETLIPDEMAHLPHPRAVWCGVLAKGDPGLFTALATELKARGGSLILIGPEAPWADDLARHMPDTIALLGSKAPVDLPRYLKAADLGVMLYDRGRQEVYRGQNPLKLYEYTAAGLPVLSTAHDEFETLNPPVAQIAQEEDVPVAVEAILADMDCQQVQVSAFALQHSWQAKVDTIMERFFPEILNQQQGKTA